MDGRSFLQSFSCIFVENDCNGLGVKKALKVLRTCKIKLFLDDIWFFQRVFLMNDKIQ